MQTIYDDSLTDDEWREANFSTETLASVFHTAGRQPSAADLITASNKYGPEGILESAIGLGQKGYRKVEQHIKQLTPPKKRRR